MTSESCLTIPTTANIFRRAAVSRFSGVLWSHTVQERIGQVSQFPSTARQVGDFGEEFHASFLL